MATRGKCLRKECSIFNTIFSIKDTLIRIDDEIIH